MPETVFTIDTLGDLDDGTVRLMIDKAIAEALDDCDSRPMLDKERKVTIALSVKPVLTSQGAMKGVDAQASVRTSLPPRTGNADYLPTSVKKDGVIAYLPDERPGHLFDRSEARSEEPS